MAKKIGTALAVGAGLAIAAIAGNYFLFGKNAKKHQKQVKGWALKMKGEILDKVEQLKDVNEKTYHHVVDSVAKNYAKAKRVSATEVAQLAKELKSHWKDIHKEFSKKK